MFREASGGARLERWPRRGDSNVIIVRANNNLVGGLAPIKLNIPTKTFRFKNEAVVTVVFERRGIAFRDRGVLYHLIGIDRQRFTDAVGASRRYR